MNRLIDKFFFSVIPLFFRYHNIFIYFLYIKVYKKWVK